MSCEMGILVLAHVLVIRELCVVLQVWKKTSVVYILALTRSNRPGPGHLCQLDYVLHSQLDERSEPDLFHVDHTG